MIAPKNLNQAFGRLLKSEGFKKRRADSWYFESADTISVVNLQKSAYGGQFYVNVAVWLKPLGEAESPPEHKCHIRCRWESLIPQDERSIQRLLNVDDVSLSDQERIAEIENVMVHHVLPFLNKAASLSDLRTLYQSGTWPSAILVQARAQRLFD